MSTVISVENVSKQYRLGEVGTGFHPELTPEDIQAALAFAADREHHLVAFSA